MKKTRVEQLQEKKAQIDAQLKAAQARERTQKRKDDTRRKIISGALALEHAERNPDSEFTAIMLRLIQEGAKTDRDRTLFDLDPLPKSPQPANAATPSPSQTQRLWNRITGGK